MKPSNYLEDLAFTLLADAACSRFDDSETLIVLKENIADAAVEESFKRLRRMMMVARMDICETVRDTCESLGVDPTQFLPLDAVTRHVAAVDKIWGEKAKVEDLYGDIERGAHALIMGATGSGMQLGDNEDEVEWLKEKGLGVRAHKAAGYISDEYYQLGEDLIEALIRKDLANEAA